MAARDARVNADLAYRIKFYTENIHLRLAGGSAKPKRRGYAGLVRWIRAKAVWV